ncbi:MAG: RNA methyltransferase [Desulfurococcaceae archaeon]
MVGSKPTVVIEHCELELGPWLLLEYRHSSKLYGKEHVLFTQMPNKYNRVMLRYGRVSEKSIVNYVLRGDISPSEIIVLDPRATNPLTYDDLASANYVVVGGILGDHPPQGKTSHYITQRMPKGTKAFNIGNGQYSIDGTVYYIEYLWRNKSVSGFEFVDGVFVETYSGSVYLPFRYPVVNNRPLLAEGLEYYLKYRKIRDDIWLEITSHDL